MGMNPLRFITRRIKRFRRNRKLSAALKIVGPAANAAGVSIEEAAALLGRCAGIDVGQARIEMRRMLRKLAQNHGEKITPPGCLLSHYTREIAAYTTEVSNE